MAIEIGKLSCSWPGKEMLQAAKVCLRGRRPQCLLEKGLIWFVFTISWWGLYVIDIMDSCYLTASQSVAMYLIKVNPIFRSQSIREINPRGVVKVPAKP